MEEPSSCASSTGFSPSASRRAVARLATRLRARLWKIWPGTCANTWSSFLYDQVQLRSKLAPEYEEWLVSAMSHGENDAFWKRPGLNVVDQTKRYKDVPVYLIGGWYDSWDLQTTMSYMALARAKRGPIKIILGPWIHGGHMHHAHGQAEFGPEAAIDSQAFHLRWYDHWLKGTDNN